DAAVFANTEERSRGQENLSTAFTCGQLLVEFQLGKLAKLLFDQLVIHEHPAVGLMNQPGAGGNHRLSKHSGTGYQTAKSADTAYTREGPLVSNSAPPV